MTPSRSILWLVCILSIFSVGACIDDKCAACSAVAAELEIQLSKEKPRNHLDMRHRLDSKGQRQGKVIDYRMSELRTIELLDGLCDKMQDYTLEKIHLNEDGSKWKTHLSKKKKVEDWDILTIDKQEAKAYSKDISSYCGRLLEESEDELTELIRKGSIKAADVNKVLCQELSKHCSSSSDSHFADTDDDDEL